MSDPGPVLRTTAELHAQLPWLRAAPSREGSVRLVVRRPAVGEREVLGAGELDPEQGMLGDGWRERVTARAVAAGRHYESQVNVMSARVVELLAPEGPERQALAGDQLYLDLDLSHENLATGSLLALGDDQGPVLEVTAKPHNGCRKFTDRFGEDALHFVNSEEGKALRLRGLNARVVRPGTVRPGDTVRVHPAEDP